MSVFRPGQTIDVVWNVYVRHVSYFRIAFDREGDDSFSVRRSMPTDPESDDPTTLPAGEGELILGYVQDRTADVERVEQRVTLPDEECARCTLQVTQFTYGLPIDDAVYHQCADIVLDADAPGGEEAPAPGADAGARPGIDRDGADDGGDAACALGAPRSKAASGRTAPVFLIALIALLRRSQSRSQLRITCGEPPLSRGRTGRAQDTRG